MDDVVRVLIVEDNTALSENLFEFFNDEHYVLDYAPDGLTALHLAATKTHDVIVLDVMLPGISGFTLCQRIREDLHSSAPIIFMTAKDHLDDKVSGFETGGDDYLVKPFDLQELALRISALHRRQKGADSKLFAAGVSYEPGTLKVYLGDHPGLELSNTAARIFETMVRAYPNLVTYEALQEQLWGVDEVDMNTLRTHVYALRKRLQTAFRNPLIKTLRGRGYRLVPPGED